MRFLTRADEGLFARLILQHMAPRELGTQRIDTRYAVLSWSTWTRADFVWHVMIVAYWPHGEDATRPVEKQEQNDQDPSRSDSTRAKLVP